ncbi:hypothetical protein K3495_g9341 [Podosphaera aphanis]|nr:hypothetical protein K3495_g9341 [Podosphaera aphanis]
MIGADVSDSSTNTSSSYTSSDEIEAETAAISKERALKSSRKNSPGWPIDTGASSHMTDNLNLFRGPLNKFERRRPIQVGGGTVWADARGTVKVIADDGSFCHLKDCLYVPGLGINLISARRLCKDGIVGIHDSRDMYFKKQNKSLQFKNDCTTFLHACQENGLYMLKSIKSKTPELAFLSTNLDSNNRKPRNDGEDQIECDSSGSDPDESENDVTSKSQRKRYRLMHRRFGHYGSEALRHLHEVASGIHKISIPPKEKRICKSCKIGKMRRKISKKLEKHQEKALALVSIDIAGPFVTSI